MFLSSSDCYIIDYGSQPYKVKAIDSFTKNQIQHFAFTLHGRPDAVVIDQNSLENISSNQVNCLIGQEVLIGSVKDSYSKKELRKVIKPVLSAIELVSIYRGKRNSEHRDELPSYEDLNDAFDGFPEATWNID